MGVALALLKVWINAWSLGSTHAFLECTLGTRIVVLTELTFSIEFERDLTVP
jgi:hypothetical protein